MDLGGAWPYLAIGALILWIYQTYNSRTYRLLRAVPSVEAPRWIGHAIKFMRIKPEGILNLMTSIFEHKSASKKVVALWMGPNCYVYLRDLSDIEKLLTDNQQLRKSDNYDFLKPWLGQGLINSEGAIWQMHRKIITPTFHFKILEGFLEIMISKLEILSEILDAQVGSDYFDIEPFIANYSFDVITETAMSSNVNAQRTNSQFIECIKSLTEIIIIRSVKIVYFIQTIFNLSPYKRLESKCTKYVNDYIEKILNSKRKVIENRSNKVTTNEVGEKRKLALLDMLLEIQSQKPKFTNKEIYDEVNTFMFAGHDTVSSALSFVIHQLAVNQDVQEKVYCEIIEVLGKSYPTYQDLMNLKYTERVIRETMRLYPSVPFIGRQLKKDMLITDGLLLPEGTNVAVFIYNHHRNPDNFPNPEKFDPDRFLTENCLDRHPFTYIPFSAGSRNCIGQKFAMLELLVTISHLLRRYRISVEPGFVLNPISHVVLRPNVEGIRIRLEKR